MKRLLTLLLLIGITGCGSDAETGSVPKGQDSATPAAKEQDPATVAYNKGVEAYGNQEWSAIIPSCTEAIRLRPDYAKAYSLRGLAYTHNKEYEKAIADLSKAIQIDPNNISAYGNRAISYEALGDNAKAKDDRATVKAIVSRMNQ